MTIAASDRDLDRRRLGTASTRVSLLDGFRFSSVGRVLALPEASQRLLAFVALKNHAVGRLEVAGTLWPDTTDHAAGGRLRSCLWRLASSGPRTIESNGLALTLADAVTVDLWEARAIAHRLLDDRACLRAADVSHEVIATLSCDILPEWYDDWALVEAEAWRQLRLHALESLAGHLTVRHRFGDAVLAASAAVATDPLRETGHAALIRVHLAEGNRSEAMRELDRYRRLLRAELNVEPTSLIVELVGSGCS